MTTYGYARVSTPTQSLTRQVENLSAYDPAIRIYQEKYSGRVAERPEYVKLKRRVLPGDTIVFDSVSRMSRDAAEGVSDYLSFFERGVNLVFLKERHIDTDVYREASRKAIDTSVSVGDDIYDRFLTTMTDGINTLLRDLATRQIELAFAQSQKEVDDLRERTREGIRVARANGKQIGGVTGRPRVPKKKAPAMATIRKHCKRYGGTLTNEETWRLAGIGRSAFYRYCKEIDEGILNS